MDSKEQVKITRTGWSKQVADDLRDVCSSTVLDNLYLAAHYEDVLLWDVTVLNGEHLGTVVTRVETVMDDGRELVIAYVGGDWFRTIHAAAPFLEGLGRFLHCERARVHAVRKGIERVLQQYQFYFSEIVLEKRIEVA